MTSVILLIGCYIAVCTSQIPVAGAEKSTNRDMMELPKSHEQDNVDVGTRGYWGNLDTHHGHGHWGNVNNGFDNYRNDRAAFPYPFIFPDQYEQVRFQGGQGGNPWQWQQGQFQRQLPVQQFQQNQLISGQNQPFRGQNSQFSGQNQRRRPQRVQNQQFRPQQVAFPVQQQQTQRSRQFPEALPGMPASYYQCQDACLTTNEYNPVCGSDNNTYNNVQRLNCARRCGLNVRFQRIGACESSIPTICQNTPNCRVT